MVHSSEQIQKKTCLYSVKQISSYNITKLWFLDGWVPDWNSSVKNKNVRTLALSKMVKLAASTTYAKLHLLIVKEELPMFNMPTATDCILFCFLFNVVVFFHQILESTHLRCASKKIITLSLCCRPRRALKGKKGTIKMDMSFIGLDH